LSLIAHISDTHFGTERAEVVSALEAMLGSAGPDLIVLSGDITQRASAVQFTAARAFLDRLDAPVLAIPGNHDIPLFDIFARLMRPFGNYRRAFGDDLEPTFESADLLVLAVNTARAHRHKDGEVSPAQIERVAARLATAEKGQLRVVVVHQPVFVTRAQDVGNLLHGHQAAVHAWARAGGDLVLGGHIHLPYIQPLRQRYEDLERDLWAVQAGTALSHRLRDGIDNSCNLIYYDAGKDGHGCHVERWDFDVATEAFRRVADTQLLLDRPAAES
jgi:3',5'-cyclic AMP phosphodiesterase CpdA